MTNINLDIEWISAAKIQLNKEQLSGKEEDTIVELLELCSDEPEVALNVIYKIIERHPSIDILRYLGAGPLEDLIVKNCHFLNELIDKAKENSQVRECLSFVNLNEDDCSNSKDLSNFLESK